MNGPAVSTPDHAIRARPPALHSQHNKKKYQLFDTMARDSDATMAAHQACLGVRFNVRDEEVRFHHLRLPEFFDEVVIRGIKFVSSAFDVMLTRHSGNDVSVKVLTRNGAGRVAVDL